MARRRTPPDPELAALSRERLARVLGRAAAGPRRAARSPDERGARDDGFDRLGRRSAQGSDERFGPGSDEGVDEEPDGRPDDRGAPPARAADHRVGLGDLEPPRRFTRWHLGVVASVLVVGLAWGGWSWVRARPEAVAAAPAVQTTGAGSGATGSAGSAGSTGATATAAAPGPGSQPSADPASGEASGNGPVVHVLGAVRHPGLVRLRAGARVQDALEAAGGLRRDADPDELNLAQPLDDGVQVVVGTRSRPDGEVRSGSGGTASGGGSSGSSDAGGSPSTGSGVVLDLNRASTEQLETLPGVGPVTAQKIADWRQQHGRFSRVEELQEVDGIGPKTYARLSPHVRV